MQPLVWSVLMLALVRLSDGVTIVTPNRYEYQEVKDVSGQSRIKFQVMACNDAHILLYQEDADPQNIQDNLIEIVIGGWGNSKSVIRTQKQQRPPVAEALHTPLDCNCFKRFWIRWDGGVIRVGSGKKANMAGEFMSYDTGSSPTINYLAISTGWGANGVWKFKNVAEGVGITKDSRADITITPKQYSYKMVTEAPGFEYIRFYVEACNDAHVLLYKAENDVNNNLYEIVFGGWGNSKSVIRKQKQGTPVAEHSHTPLDCDERKPFWIRWDENTIRVGAGRDVNAGKFMTYVDPTPTDVNYIAVSTGWGATGVWWFNLACLTAYQPKFVTIPSFPNCTMNIGQCVPDRFCKRGQQNCDPIGTTRKCVPKYRKEKKECAPGKMVKLRVVEKCACKKIRPVP